MTQRELNPTPTHQPTNRPLPHSLSSKSNCHFSLPPSLPLPPLCSITVSFCGLSSFGGTQNGTFFFHFPTFPPPSGLPLRLTDEIFFLEFIHCVWRFLIKIYPLRTRKETHFPPRVLFGFPYSLFGGDSCWAWNPRIEEEEEEDEGWMAVVATQKLSHSPPPPLLWTPKPRKWRERKKRKKKTKTNSVSVSFPFFSLNRANNNGPFSFLFLFWVDPPSSDQLCTYSTMIIMSKSGLTNSGSGGENFFSVFPFLPSISHSAMRHISWEIEICAIPFPVKIDAPAGGGGGVVKKGRKTDDFPNFVGRKKGKDCRCTSFRLKDSIIPPFLCLPLFFFFFSLSPLAPRSAHGKEREREKLL